MSVRRDARYQAGKSRTILPPGTDRYPIDLRRQTSAVWTPSKAWSCHGSRRLLTVNELRRCIRDLVALSTLPAVWTNYNPRRSPTAWRRPCCPCSVPISSISRCPPIRASRPLKPSTSTGDGPFRWAAKRQFEPLCTMPGSVGPNKRGSSPTPSATGRIRVVRRPDRLSRGCGRSLPDPGEPKFPTDMQRLLLGYRSQRHDRRVAAAEARKWRSDASYRWSNGVLDFIGIASLDGVPYYVNPAGLSSVGLETLEQARSSACSDFLLPEERTRAREMCWPEAMRMGRWRGELIFRNFETGRALPFLVDWFRIDHPRTRQPMNIATVSRDLTAQKRSEGELRHLAETLEHSVAERTAELAEANDRLRAQMIERERPDVRLQKCNWSFSTPPA